MNFSIKFEGLIEKEHMYFHPSFLLEKINSFKTIITKPDIGFFELSEFKEQTSQARKTYQQFKDKKNFVHVGIGGSSLGPEMLIEALRPKSNQTKFYFLNNIDPDLVDDILSKISPKESIFYIVSKSGGTAETLATLALLINWLKEKGVSDKEFGKYFVFATDPYKGDLRKFSQEQNIPCLNIPPNVGGRFSVFTSVGIFPALFADIDVDKIYEGIEEIKPLLLTEDLSKNLLAQVASTLAYLKLTHSINQTVLIPYSSKLKTLSLWFVQLWAESLGKKVNNLKEIVHEGLTPIPAYGTTDQHSQMQLFMEGPLDKCLLFLEIKQFQNDFPLKNNFPYQSLRQLSPHSLSVLMKAHLEGTLKALKEIERPFFHFEVPILNEKHLGSLILFLESLTVFISQYFQINPFDQPGVEAGKIYAFEFLKNLNN